MGGGWRSGDKLCWRATCLGIANWNSSKCRIGGQDIPFYRTQLVQVQRPDIFLTSLLHAERDRPWRSLSGYGREHPQFFAWVEMGGILRGVGDEKQTRLGQPQTVFISRSPAHEREVVTIPDRSRLVEFCDGSAVAHRDQAAFPPEVVHAAIVVLGVSILNHLDLRPKLLFNFLRGARIVHFDQQADIASSNGQVRVIALGFEPRLRARSPVVEQLGSERRHNQNLNQRDHGGLCHRICLRHHDAPPAVRATSLRRNCSSSHPPSKNRSPKPTSDAERPSLSITLEK